ncbi:MAG: Asp-tRNA(Asn)/Glu-tRNA(Gln) amidotransferase subunit GatB [Patescibacteria group bacterium]|jgi:aspartyl-tRNA(Asn)/glutamyl-tRNA(Gln) amidotransferase subunit B|nr:Asp-tRNA(Asn)/Glu-tRNA(Gln) amidotransferase subunit GatB [Patescibacteria group bacterium]
MTKYKPTIGMEIHVELATKSKMFCACKNGMGEEKEPNKNICPVCTGQPGSLPVPNREAINFVMKAGLALNCKIANDTKFDRKNYFYPDLPKGYQISQYDKPICEKGSVEIEFKDEKEMIQRKTIGITRIHLEEDTGKSIHQKGSNSTLVDFNRAGVPLMELVTEPDITSASEAKAFCEELRLLFRYLEISPADMEKGQMRCEANISLYKPGQDPLSGTKVELKNINSFKAIEKGILYEIERQSEALESQEKLTQETRGWDEKLGETFSQREKENSDDYRYFPEPDILPLKYSDEYIGNIKRSIGELPQQKKLRFIEQFGLSIENAKIIVNDKDLANYFEQVCSELENWMQEEGHDFDEKVKTKLYRLAANYLMTELQKYLMNFEGGIKEIKITPENFAELIKIVYEGEINSSAAQTVLEEMFNTGGDPSHIIEEKNLGQTSDEGELGGIVEKIIANNPSSVEDYKAGKDNAIKFLMGQIMKETQGKANPQMVMEILKEKLK